METTAVPSGFLWVMTEVYSHLHAHLHIAQIYYGSEDWKDGVLMSKREHSAVLGNLESNRFEEAGVLLKNHIRRSMAMLISALNDRSGAVDQLCAMIIGLWEVRWKTAGHEGPATSKNDLAGYLGCPTTTY